MQELGYVFEAITSWPIVVAAFVGVLWGMCGGSLPGISTSIAMALLLPFTFSLDPSTAMVLLASVYVGAEYGGSIPAILIRTPASGSAAATVFDGYEMHRQGRSGEALGLSLVGGTIGGLVGLIVLTLLTERLADFALLFTPPAYFALGLLGISVVASVSSGAPVKGLIAGVLGLAIATVGTDPLSGVARFTFGRPELLEGIGIVTVMMGVFAVSELMMQSRRSDAGGNEQAALAAASTRLVLPSLKTLWRLRVAQVIAWVLGIIEGLTPGGGGSIASFMSYNEAKRWSKEPEKFGKGSEEGVIAPETANNVVASTALIPTLSFGIPGSNSTAVLLGALLIHGLQPGPLLFTAHPDVVYGLFGGLFVANFAMLLLGAVLLTPVIWLVRRPKPFLQGGIFVLIISGIYSINQSVFDIGLILVMGLLGYVLRTLRFPLLPLVLGVVLGFMIESNYRRSLLLTQGDHMVFLRDPTAAVLIGLALLLVATSIFREAKYSRPKPQQTGERREDSTNISG
ncbi:MAG TPA: tripartite tricarboxylate transporter permease [Mesorhizobium sp.]|jgi:putative tricarboxylic transport membrane protein|nr:tripartite tricarboxylate transporter permease [Mesorhizobium sp.]